MIIALDYDDTYTRDPDTWNAIARILHIAGHIVIGVTMRHPAEASGMHSSYDEAVDRIYFTGRKAKQAFMRDLGVLVDVWIDDRPDFILRDALS